MSRNLLGSNTVHCTVIMMHQHKPLTEYLQLIIHPFIQKETFWAQVNVRFN